MKKLFFTSALLVTALFFNSCSSDDDGSTVVPSPTPAPVASNTIVDFVSANADYSSLGAALEAANLIDVLNGTDQYTVFAPNNAAFEAFLSGFNPPFASLADVPVDVLTQVLLNHVITGTTLSGAIETDYYKTNATFGTTSNNLSMYINKTDVVLINGQALVTSPDNIVDNGVIHAVDAVIGLPTVVTFATADSTFETLVAALTAEEDFPFVSLLSETNGTGSTPFTVFAPTNNAFGNLLDYLELSSLSEIPTETLALTLSTHVVDGANVLSTDLVDGMTVETKGDTFTINTDPSATFTDQNDRMGNIIVTDVQAANGVIHVIDEVILPAL